MYLHVAPDGTVKAVHDIADLKTHFKYAGWDGKAFEVTASEVDLEQFRPKRAAVVAHPSAVAHTAALAAQDQKIAQLTAMVQQLIALQGVKPDPVPEPGTILDAAPKKPSKTKPAAEPK